jgi:glutathione S-transferase
LALVLALYLFALSQQLGLGGKQQWTQTMPCDYASFKYQKGFFMAALPLTTLVTVIAICLYFFMGLRVGLARAKYNVPAPATTGDPTFERMNRVHMNTLEGMPIFLPLLWLFASYHSDAIAAAIGLVWVIGRIIFMLAYTADAGKRSGGFQIQFLAVIILLIGTIVGAVQALLN